MFAHFSIPRFACVIALLTTAAWGQTFYSPGGVGTVAQTSEGGNGTTTANIFAWDIDANSNSTGFDTYTATTKRKLVIDGTGEVFRVVFGTNVDINNAFWNTNQTWNALIVASGSNASVSNLSQTNVSAYTYSGGTYTLVDTSARGSFSLSNNNLTWNAVPEPTSALAGLLIVGGLLRRRR